MVDIAIRPATIQDIRALAEMGLALLDNPEVDEPELYSLVIDLVNAISNPKQLVLVALDNERPIGTLQFRIHPDGNVEALGFYVLPEYRNRGIGPLLIKNALTYIEALDGKTKMIISTYLDNPIRKSIGKLGFEPLLTIYSAPLEVVRERMIK